MCTQLYNTREHTHLFLSLACYVHTGIEILPRGSDWHTYYRVSSIHWPSRVVPFSIIRITDIEMRNLHAGHNRRWFADSLRSFVTSPFGLFMIASVFAGPWAIAYLSPNLFSISGCFEHFHRHPVRFAGRFLRYRKTERGIECTYIEKQWYLHVQKSHFLIWMNSC